MWTTNNASCVWGLLRVLNMPKDMLDRTAFLTLQGMVWLCFSLFNALYFGVRSPTNGAVDTNIGLAATIAIMYIAPFRLGDTRAALSRSTILPWLVLASATATTVALWNRDEFYGTDALIDPEYEWVRVIE